MEKKHTLNSIALDLNREKRTVQSWYQKAKAESGRDIGELVEGTRYFSDEDRELLVSYAGSQRSPKTLSIPPITVDAGNHAITLVAPDLPQAYSLEGLRSSDAIGFEDPLTVAQQFLEIADQIESAMQNDLQQREAKLRATKQAKAAIAAKADKLRLEQRLYQLQTNQLDSQVSTESHELQEQLQLIQKLGKPQSPVD